MHKRITSLLVAGLAVAAVGMTPTVAAAKHGADDAAGHVRHSGADDSTKASKSKSTQRRGRGADDAAGHTRRGRGTDDGPNHR
ncbi:MAG: hypothetical protein QOI64_2191 [Solirubrobacteraceae bacterium]|jgi:hypothetical protein|nr:hypothetical protein [Solirubrobacteraceae bacterium]